MTFYKLHQHQNIPNPYKVVVCIVFTICIYIYIRHTCRYTATAANLAYNIMSQYYCIGGRVRDRRLWT